MKQHERRWFDDFLLKCSLCFYSTTAPWWRRVTQGDVNPPDSHRCCVNSVKKKKAQTRHICFQWCTIPWFSPNEPCLLLLHLLHLPSTIPPAASHEPTAPPTPPSCTGPLARSSRSAVGPVFVRPLHRSRPAAWDLCSRALLLPWPPPPPPPPLSPPSPLPPPAIQPESAKWDSWPVRGFHSNLAARFHSAPSHERSHTDLTRVLAARLRCLGWTSGRVKGEWAGDRTGHFFIISHLGWEGGMVGVLYWFICCVFSQSGAPSSRWVSLLHRPLIHSLTHSRLCRWGFTSDPHDTRHTKHPPASRVSNPNHPEPRSLWKDRADKWKSNNPSKFKMEL